MKLFKGKLTLPGRILFVLAGVCLIACIFFPLWHLDLEAPQYPEGLSMNVYMDKIGGRIDIINNLNHYIGMKEITESDFPELQFMSKLAIGFAILAVIAALTKRAWIGTLNLFLLCIGGGLGIYDLWYWLHQYGTDLEPSAPITVAPFVPPMIGSNKVANFVTHTGFNLGGYLLGLSIVLMVIALWRFNVCEKKEVTVKHDIRS